MGLPENSVNKGIDMSPNQIEYVINRTYDTYFSGSAIMKAKEQNDEKLSQFLLRLRDLASIVEANSAMSDGDIGRLMFMWKRWAVSSQGMKSLTHYSNYLPRLIILLKETLPNDVAHTILHSFLITPSGRPGHFVAKDFFLEVQNYWIKYFYNQSVRSVLVNHEFFDHLLSKINFSGNGNRNRSTEECLLNQRSDGV